jgi:hypothetical protein
MFFRAEEDGAPHAIIAIAKQPTDLELQTE